MLSWCSVNATRVERTAVVGIANARLIHLSHILVDWPHSMATPRVFISSTCYDLNEVRFQLRRFITEIGYEPVLSEFGDIFYDLSSHVQDACRDEVARCNLFILVVGNNYGSLYHRGQVTDAIPDSVTLQEFRKALEVGVPKFIFVNRFVHHDHGNYRRALERSLTAHFSSHKVDDAEIESTRQEIKQRSTTHIHFHKIITSTYSTFLT
jgi:hypothetical protein